MSPYRKRPSNYTMFRYSLDLNFKDFDVTSKEQLKFLMTNKGFRTKFDKKDHLPYSDEVTDKQVQYAWSYLKTGYGQSYIIPTFKSYTIKYRYGERKVYRDKLGRFAKGDR